MLSRNSCNSDLQLQAHTYIHMELCSNAFYIYLPLFLHCSIETSMPFTQIVMQLVDCILSVGTYICVCVWKVNSLQEIISLPTKEGVVKLPSQSVLLFTVWSVLLCCSWLLWKRLVGRRLLPDFLPLSSADGMSCCMSTVIFPNSFLYWLLLIVFMVQMLDSSHTHR